MKLVLNFLSSVCRIFCPTSCSIHMHIEAMMSGDEVVCWLKLKHTGFSLKKIISSQCNNFWNLRVWACSILMACASDFLCWCSDILGIVGTSREGLSKS